ncbi:YbaB/EbfC family nucleoid-associated protein [Kribbella sp. CA-294648]|uniref:YbaB/EbfC family nucleoid-associated protein n=1 Tax=Kribbella sp. CA-294648 TaxID=3239948 RepID=UPI003D921087
MFDGGGSQGAGGFDMSNLLAQAQAMQSQLMEAQANLESQEIEGSAGGGLVTALVSGTGELLSLTIKPQAVDPDDTETLADLIVAAVRDASENAKQVAANAMGPLAGGLGGGMPGLDGIFGGAEDEDETTSKPSIGFGKPGATGTPDATGTPATGTPATGTPATGTPATGTPATGTPATGTPATGTPDAPTPGAAGSSGQNPG